jgi:hypothetical protein
MGAAFWIRRFFTVAIGAFAVIFVVQALKDHELSYAASHAAIWGPITGAVFVAAGIIRSRSACRLTRLD